MTGARSRDRTATIDGAPAGESQDARRLRQAVQAGRPWREALLQAMERWTLPEESYRGLHRRYLLLGEAFDWLLLARRLGAEIADLIPEGERRAELHSGRFLLEMPAEEVRRLIGVTKYRSYLNYWYGVTVEQALQIAVQRDVRKERYSLGVRSRRGLTDAVFGKIYGHSRTDLLAEFRTEWAIAGPDDAPGTELKAFTYWLFKRRVYRSDPARVASDTRKALEWLHARLGVLPTVAAEELASHLAAHRR